jgi:hypothetical protein
MLLNILAGVISGLICAGILEAVRRIRARRAKNGIKPINETEKKLPHSPPTKTETKTRIERNSPPKATLPSARKKYGRLFFFSLFISLFLGLIASNVIEEFFPRSSHYKEFISFFFIISFTAMIWIYLSRKDTLSLNISLNRKILSPIIGFIMGALSEGIFQMIIEKEIQADSPAPASPFFFITIWTVAAWFYLGKTNKKKKGSG